VAGEEGRRGADGRSSPSAAPLTSYAVIAAFLPRTAVVVAVAAAANAARSSRAAAADCCSIPIPIGSAPPPLQCVIWWWGGDGKRTEKDARAGIFPPRMGRAARELEARAWDRRHRRQVEVAPYNARRAGGKPSEHEPGPSSREATAPGSFLQNFPLADGIQTRVVRALKQVQLNV